MKAKVRIKQKKQQKTQVSAPKPKAKTPFADAGEIAGKRIGQMFNMPMLKGVGRWLGSGIGTILGSGDYTLMGEVPRYNVLTNGNQIPKFSTTAQTNVVCHREYLGDITGTSAFTNLQYALNPGLESTFPWLSTVAQNYQEYKFHGLVFEFRPLITDFVTSGAPGVVVMATNYNADATAYATKQQMENSEYAVSVKPTLPLMHGVECAGGQTPVPQKYIRSGSVPTGQDLRLYDQGLFQFATQSNPVQNLGELWVSYCVEFFKPAVSTDIGGNATSSHAYRTGVDSTHQAGTTTVFSSGNMALSFPSAASFAFATTPGNTYLVNVLYTSSTAGTVGCPTMNATAAAAVNLFVGDTATAVYEPFGGTNNSTGSAGTFVFLAGATSTTVTFTGGAFTTGTVLDVTVTEISNLLRQ